MSEIVGLVADTTMLLTFSSMAGILWTGCAYCTLTLIKEVLS